MTVVFSVWGICVPISSSITALLNSVVFSNTCPCIKMTCSFSFSETYHPSWWLLSYWVSACIKDTRDLWFQTRKETCEVGGANWKRAFSSQRYKCWAECSSSGQFILYFISFRYYLFFGQPSYHRLTLVSYNIKKKIKLYKTYTEYK